MQDKFTLDYSFIDSYKLKQKTTEFERHGIQVKTGAPVTGAVTINGSVAACFGDGSVRFFNSENPPITIKAHRGGLSLPVIMTISSLVGMTAGF